MHKVLIFDFFEVIHEDPLLPWFNRYDLERKGEIARLCDLLDLGKIQYQNFLEQLGKIGGQTAKEVGTEFGGLAGINHAVVGLIEDLRAENYRLGLLSNAHHEELRPLLKHHNLLPLFHEVIISAEVGLAKPDPKIFQLMMKRLQAQPNQCIFVDDNYENVTSARKLGITGVCYQNCTDLKAQLNELGIMKAGVKMNRKRHSLER